MFIHSIKWQIIHTNFPSIYFYSDLQQKKCLAFPVLKNNGEFNSKFITIFRCWFFRSSSYNPMIILFAINFKYNFLIIYMFAFHQHFYLQRNKRKSIIIICV